MKAPRALIRKMREQRGAGIALVALTMVALLSAVALAVDVGMMVTARTEAQRVADASALAGAGILAVEPDNEGGARSEAISFALQNSVRGTAAEVLPGDVDVDLDESTVAVTVRRTAARGNPLGTFFARVFGVNTVDITAYAKAIAEPVGPSSGTNCLLPIMLPDRWLESPPENYPTADDSFDPEIPDPKPNDYDDDDVWDVYVPPTEATPQNPSTGYDDSVIGAQIEIHKAGGGGGGMNPSWYFPWTPLDAEDQLEDGGPGAANYEERFTVCMQSTYAAGDFVLTEPGAMVGPTNDGFDDIYNTDPEMYWNESPTGPTAPANGKGCPWRPSLEDEDGNVVGGCDYNSPRVRPMPMFDPREAPDNGRKEVPLTNFGSVFVEQPQNGQAFSARWLGLLPSDPQDADDDDELEGLPKKLRLIE